MLDLDYKVFKKEMEQREHKVYKQGNYITIIPDNNYLGYSKGFQAAEEVIDGFNHLLKTVSMEHFNTWIYQVKFRIA